MSKKRKRYSDDFRASAVLMLEAAGYPQQEGAILYGIFEKGANQPFYIGSSKYGSGGRFDAHLSAVKLGTHSNRHFSNKAKKLGFDNIEYRIIHRVSEQNQFYAERSLIEWAIGEGVKLTNKIYNGVDFDIQERRWDYENHPGMTPDRIEALWRDMGPPKAGDPKDQPLLDRFHMLLLSICKSLLEKHEEQTRRDYPGFLEWYEEYTKLNGAICE